MNRNAAPSATADAATIRVHCDDELGRQVRCEYIVDSLDRLSVGPCGRHCVAVRPSVRRSVCLSVYLSVGPSVRPSVVQPSVRPSVCGAVRLSVRSFVRSFVHPCVDPSICVSVTFCVASRSRGARRATVPTPSCGSSRSSTGQTERDHKYSTEGSQFHVLALCSVDSSQLTTN